MEVILDGVPPTARSSTQPTEPEAVWALEFLAELATLLELHDKSAELYAGLSVLFDDWRGSYYEALGLYERGESLVRELSNQAVVSYQAALEVLQAIGTTDDDAKQAIEFRSEIIRARMLLQQALYDWETTFDPVQLDVLADHLLSVARIFARYGRAVPPVEGVKRLSDRELEYLNGTRRMVEIMASVVSLEALQRRGSSSMEAYRAKVRNIADALKVLSGMFDQLARGPRQLAREATDTVNRILGIMENPQATPTQFERSVAALSEELRDKFRSSTWPMPARACPIGGLGRGTLSPIAEDISGDGSVERPYLLPADSPPVFNVLAEITEMAPGGSTRAYVQCNTAGQTVEQPVHAVEGPVRCTFLLPDVLSTVTATRCNFALVFDAKDCSQISGQLEIFIRRETRRA
jgi:hypothetical protein